MDTTRRDLLKSGAALAGTAAGLALTGTALAQGARIDIAPEPSTPVMPPTPPSVRRGDMPYRTRQVALEGTTELFKTSSHFDSTARNPDWLG